MKANLKFMRSTAAAFGLIALGVAPVFAADAVMDEPPAPAPFETLPVASWAGPYAGIALGYGFTGRTDVGDLEIDTDGFIANGFAGYQLDSNGFVNGIEGDIGYGGYKGDNAGVEFEGGVSARSCPYGCCRDAGCADLRHRRWRLAEREAHRYGHRQQRPQHHARLGRPARAPMSR